MSHDDWKFGEVKSVHVEWAKRLIDETPDIVRSQLNAANPGYWDGVAALFAWWANHAREISDIAAANADNGYDFPEDLG